MSYKNEERLFTPLKNVSSIFTPSYIRSLFVYIRTDILYICKYIILFIKFLLVLFVILSTIKSFDYMVYGKGIEIIFILIYGFSFLSFSFLRLYFFLLIVFQVRFIVTSYCTWSLTLVNGHSQHNCIRIL